MRSFSTRRWSPPGARLTVLALPSLQVLDLAAAYVRTASQWWSEQSDRPLGDVFDVLGPRLHLTLAWFDRPTESITDAERTAVAADLARVCAALPPLTLTVGPAILSTSALELYVTPSPQAAVLAGAAHDALAGVFGPFPRRPYRPHMAAFYARRDLGTESLTSRFLNTPGPTAGLLAPIPMPLGGLVLVDQDTFSPAGRALG